MINIHTSIMGLPINFMKKDRGYSWIALLAIVINNFCCMGYLFTSTGIYGSIYPDLLQEERSKTNAIGSTLVGVFLFTGKKIIYIRLLDLRNKFFSASLPFHSYVTIDMQ